ncbi:MAG TPA: PDZ domain-containing protein [Flavobacteriales bacterium]
MIDYRIFYSHPHRHFISFEAKFPVKGKSVLQLQLPAWRPGRYELGNFAKNIRMWHALDEYGNVLSFKKKSKDLWEVDCLGLEVVNIRYQYYAAELNAGSTYLDEEQLYINPVNCFFYDVENASAPYRLQFYLPERYQIATGLTKESEHTLLADSFDQLADSPLIASASLQHLYYGMNNVIYHIWIQGDVTIDEDRLIREFAAFTEEQLNIFGDIPCKEYHFLFQFVPYRLRHGVEHCNSTVITMGPATDFASDEGFKDLLAISCHELFHTWNVKNIRPKEMMPYDFSRENYSELGYVAEGVTTYYGDYLLWRSGSFSDAEWLNVLTDTINVHVSNPGRFNLSVAESSFETWLDGYVQGIPWRKVSIYNEGCLVALICDLMILNATGGKQSLDDVMRKMYEDFGKTNKGYTSQDYRLALEQISGQSFEHIFSSLVFGTDDYIPFLKEALNTVGLEMVEKELNDCAATHFGLVVDESQGKVVVRSVAEGSPADMAKLWVGDEILSVNRVSISHNFNQLLRAAEGSAEFTVLSKGVIRKRQIFADGTKYNLRYKVRRNDAASKAQIELYTKWKSRYAVTN